MQRPDHSPRRYLSVAQQLLLAITSGEYAAGDQLPPDREIAAQTGVSRATAREAVLALELIGAVEVRHGDGTFVQGSARIGGAGSPLDVPPRELIETRRTVEPVVAGLAARRITSEAIAELGGALDEAEQLVSELEALPRFTELSLRFHADLAPACGNSVLAGLVAQFVHTENHPLWVLVNQQMLSSVEARQSQVTAHRAVLAAVTAGDQERAERAMRTHLQELEEAIFLMPSEPTVSRSSEGRVDV